ncbi:MAG TPA: SdrD B-like domain-containing protein, partial [Bacteroidota bacterium]|nr:SdrD B-like domain-containing protein [Bacteroidota bacterium]
MFTSFSKTGRCHVHALSLLAFVSLLGTTAFGQVSRPIVKGAVMRQPASNTVEGQNEIGGTVFVDKNENRLKDSGEPGIPGWKIFICGPVNDSATTDAAGAYQFINLPSGSYHVSEGYLSGWYETSPSHTELQPDRDDLIRNFDEIFSHLYVIATDAYSYRQRAAEDSGGGGSYGGYKVPSNLQSTDNGAYSPWSPVAAGAQSFNVTGASTSYPGNNITAVLDSNGALHTFSFFGDFPPSGYGVEAFGSNLTIDSVNIGNLTILDTIIASASTGGTINPSGNIVISSHGDTTFTFTPNTGYHSDSVIVDGVKVDSLASYRFRNVTFNHTIRVVFANLYTITSSAGANGGISPFGQVSVNPGGSQTFNFTPSTGYHVDSLIVDGVSQAIAASYTFTNVTTNHTIRVAFHIDQFTISASAGANGSISPSGAISVSYGGNQTFNFTPSTGYHVDSLIVDGVSEAVAASYTFTNVTTNHTIRVVFRIDQFTISASAGANGSISPSGAISVSYGGNQTFNFT